jgi:nitroimidazol reductase NimA-like FMN-containing flavoprotein (pyridoxamine 5'-phosphate oxidase superfamily)
MIHIMEKRLRGGGSSMATRGVGDMTDAEVTDFIKQSACGVVTVMDGNRPYSVVLEHYYHGKNFYFGCSTREDQRKLRCIRENPHATFMMYQSRRENPGMLKQDTKCRSVLVEGKLREAEIKTVKSREFGQVNLKLLKLEPDIISNWRCTRKTCDWETRWYERYPELVADL